MAPAPRQSRVERRPAGAEWSPRRTLSFVLAVSGGFWGGFAWLVLPQLLK